ncbi:MAG: biotin transport system substrate-specific component [Methanolobus sp.]|nr:biotin transport system substrate-specific component [Methanolobus sp.]
MRLTAQVRKGESMNENYHYENYYESDVRKMAMASLFTALIAVGAFIRIPVLISPVPITLQVLFIFLAGAMLGARWGSMSVMIYLLLGIIGLPVFSGGSSGIGVLFGPTGGYLVGFVLAAFVIGLFSDKWGTSGVLRNMLFMSAGLLVIYLLGAAYMVHVARISVESAILLGVAPFIPGDLLKLVFSSVIAAKYSLD